MELRLGRLQWQRPRDLRHGYEWAGDGSKAVLRESAHYEPVNYEPGRGLSLNFARIKDAKGVLDFADKYGALEERCERPDLKVWLSQAEQMRAYLLLAKALKEESAKDVAKWT